MTLSICLNYEHQIYHGNNWNHWRMVFVRKPFWERRAIREFGRKKNTSHWFHTMKLSSDIINSTSSIIPPILPILKILPVNVNVFLRSINVYSIVWIAFYNFMGFQFNVYTDFPMLIHYNAMDRKWTNFLWNVHCIKYPKICDLVRFMGQMQKGKWTEQNRVALKNKLAQFGKKGLKWNGIRNRVSGQQNIEHSVK